MNIFIVKVLGYMLNNYFVALMCTVSTQCESREVVRHLGQLAMATPLEQITCGYLLLMLNVTD